MVSHGLSVIFVSSSKQMMQTSTISEKKEKLVISKK